MKKLHFPSFLKFEAIKSNHTPEILINDPRSGNAVRSDFRTVLLNYLADISGNPATDAVGYFEVTLLELQTMQTDNAVQPGFFYYITDRDIMLQGVATDRVSLHGALYIKVSPGSNEVDYVEFDVINDIVLRRRDKRGNDVALSKEYLDDAALPYTTINEFYWLNDEVYGNTVVDSYVSLDDGVTQFVGRFNNNLIINRSVVDLVSVVSDPTAIFTANTINAGQVIVNSDPDIYQFYNNNILNGSTVTEESEYLSAIYDCTLTNYSHINSSSQYASSTIGFVTLSNYSVFNIYTGAAITVRTTSFTYSTVSDQSIVNITLGASSTTNISASNVRSFSTLALVNVVGGSLSRVEVNNFSLLSITDKTGGQNIQNINVQDASSLTFTSLTSGAAITDFSIKESSVVSIGSTAGTLNNWFVSGNSSVTLAANTTNKTNLVIRRWTVTLHASTAHSSGTLDVSMDSSFTPVYRSTITQFPTYASRVAAGVFTFNASTVDVYTGFWYIVTPAGGTISSFANPSVPTTNMAICFQADINETLVFAQDAAPVASGGIGMNVASITLSGQDGNVTADTLTLQKSSQNRYAVIEHFNIT